MTDRAATPLGRLLALIGSLHVEICILAFCVVIYLGAGTTSGPVFDVIGPEALPTATSVLVGALVLVQIAVQLFRARHDPPPAVRINPALLRNLLVFTVATILFVLIVAQGWLTFALATCAFMTVTTMLLSDRLHWRDAATGAATGLLLGIVLQITFTYVLFIDLAG